MKSKQKPELKGVAQSSDLAMERIQSLEASVPLIQHWLMNFLAQKDHLQKGSHCLEHILREQARPLSLPLPQSPIDLGQAQFRDN